MKAMRKYHHLIQVMAGCKGDKGVVGRNEVRHGAAHQLQVLWSRGHVWAAFVCSGKRGERSTTTLKSSERQQFIMHTQMHSLQPELQGEQFREHVPTTSLSLVLPESSMGVPTSHCHHISVCPSVTEKSKEHTNMKSHYKQLLYYQLLHFQMF